MKLSDLKGLLNKSTLSAISVENPYEDYYQIKLSSEQKNWTPGEHAIFTMPGKEIKGKKFRAFSVASSPEEGFIMIGTRTGASISSYKQALTQLKPGDKVKMIGPFGWFKLQDEASPIVLIASGVGITPIRALLKQIETDKKREVTVIYSSKDYYLFGDEIEAISEKNDQINLIKTHSRQETQDSISHAVSKYKNEAFYFVSGAVPVIKSIKRNIKAEGISKQRIISDPFFGY
jgi:ferredoxin-NADP reductase